MRYWRANSLYSESLTKSYQKKSFPQKSSSPCVFFCIMLFVKLGRERRSVGCVHRVRSRLWISYGKRSRPRKIPPLNVGFGVGPLPSAKHIWHTDNFLDAKITAGLVHNGEIGFYIHILWLYSSSISQSYRGFTGFGGICSGIPRLSTPRQSRKDSILTRVHTGKIRIWRW